MVSLYDFFFTIPNVLILVSFFKLVKTMGFAEDNKIVVSE